MKQQASKKPPVMKSKSGSPLVVAKSVQAKKVKQKAMPKKAEPKKAEKPKVVEAKSVPPKSAPMPPPADGAQSTSAYTGKADGYVPVFSNNQRDYREYRKRAEIYKTKMDLANRSRETVFNLITLMQGKAWDLVEDLTTDEMQSEEGFAKAVRAA